MLQNDPVGGATGVLYIRRSVGGIWISRTKKSCLVPRRQLSKHAIARNIASGLSVFPGATKDAPLPKRALVTKARFIGYSDCSNDPVSADADDMTSLNSQFDLLGRLIEATEVRQRAISNNLANVNTPNYRRVDVEFEEQLAQELKSLKSSNGNSTITAKPEMVLSQGLTVRADGNNVDIDHEIGQQQKNAMMQQTYIQLLSTYLDQMRLAIQGQ